MEAITFIHMLNVMRQRTHVMEGYCQKKIHIGGERFYLTLVSLHPRPPSIHWLWLVGLTLGDSLPEYEQTRPQMQPVYDEGETQ